MTTYLSDEFSLDMIDVGDGQRINILPISENEVKDYLDNDSDWINIIKNPIKNLFVSKELKYSKKPKWINIDLIPDDILLLVKNTYEYFYIEVC